ncbi:MAG TPA: hypothetical protein EYQ48_01385, partial [Candidatus Lambdaproteobacteria bacterium]|nr:hypothetical protein [Candidatus Lambdaproteobacteria bacterium]
LYHGRYLHPLKDYLVGSTESFGRLFSQMPSLANALLSWPLSRMLLKNLIGLRDLPEYSPESVRRLLQKVDAPAFDVDELILRTPEELERSVILL